MVMLWVGLSTAVLLCLFRRQGWLGNHLRTTVITISLTLLMTLLASFMSLGLGSALQFGPTAQDVGFTLARNLAVAAILVGLALRYFYLHYESDLRLKVQATARLQALQAYRFATDHPSPCACPCRRGRLRVERRSLRGSASRRRVPCKSR